MTESIQPNSKLCQDLSAIPEKFIVDYANTIDVLKDHEKVQRLPQRFFGRLYKGFTGQGWQQQYEVNSNLISHIEAQFRVLNDLSTTLTCGLKAAHEVSEKLQKLTDNITEIVHFSVENRKQIEVLTNKFNEKFEEFEQRLGKIELENAAQQHFNLVFSKWDAGRFCKLSIAGRAYAVLEELNWGSYGNLLRTLNEREVDKQLEFVSNRLLSQICKDANTQYYSRLAYRDWLAPTSDDSDYQVAIEYLASDYDTALKPFISSLHSSCIELPISVPRICDAQRLSEALAREVLGRCV